MNVLHTTAELRRLARTLHAIAHRLRRALTNPETPDFEIEIIMTQLQDSLDANTAAVATETTAVNALIAAHTSAPVEPTADQLAQLAASTAQSAANTTAIDAVLNPPAPVDPSPVETPAT